MSDIQTDVVLPKGFHDAVFGVVNIAMASRPVAIVKKQFPEVDVEVIAGAVAEMKNKQGLAPRAFRA